MKGKTLKILITHSYFFYYKHLSSKLADQYDFIMLDPELKDEVFFINNTEHTLLDTPCDSFSILYGNSKIIKQAIVMNPNPPNIKGTEIDTSTLFNDALKLLPKMAQALNIKPKKIKKIEIDYIENNVANITMQDKIIFPNEQSKHTVEFNQTDLLDSADLIDKEHLKINKKQLEKLRKQLASTKHITRQLLTDDIKQESILATHLTASIMRVFRYSLDKSLKLIQNLVYTGHLRCSYIDGSESITISYTGDHKVKNIEYMIGKRFKNSREQATIEVGKNISKEFDKDRSANQVEIEIKNEVIKAQSNQLTIKQKLKDNQTVADYLDSELPTIE